jgi:hypothetical protein
MQQFTKRNDLQDSQTSFTMKFAHSTTPSADDPTVSMSKSIFHVSSQGDYKI